MIFVWSASCELLAVALPRQTKPAASTSCFSQTSAGGRGVGGVRVCVGAWESARSFARSEVVCALGRCRGGVGRGAIQAVRARAIVSCS